ncbi:hypothetical protein DMENIID0001_009710 [Sergentomyia squamirostris]
MEKSAVSLLQELCIQNRVMNPIYEDLSTEFDDFYEYSVKVFGLVAMARGMENKLAKENAARKMLENIEDRKILVIEKSEINISGNFINYVGALLEFCSQNRLQPPSFEYTLIGLDCGFLVTCRMRNIETHSKDKSKKGGKHAAAKAMLEKLKDLSCVEKFKVQRPGSNLSNSERCSFKFTEDAMETARKILSNETSMDDKKVVLDVCKALGIPCRQNRIFMADEEKEVFEMDLTYTYVNLANTDKAFDKPKKYLISVLENYANN